MTSANQDLVTLQDFIVGRLSGSELQAFEDRLLSEPALVRELEMSLRMREGLQRVQARGDAGRAASRSTRLRAWVPALIAASAAGVALFLWQSSVVAPSPVLLASLESSASINTTSAVVAHFTFVSMRSGSAPDLDLPATGLIEIRAAAGADQAGQRYHVSLAREEEGSVAQSVAALPSLAVGTDGYLHFYADASRLVAGTYLLRIEPDTGAADTAETFAFNLRR